MFNYKLMSEDVQEMNMTQLTHNQFFIKNGEAWYRDYDREISCRNLIRDIALNLCIWEEDSPEMEDAESFDETMLDYLQYGTTAKEGILAMYYSAMWGMAEVRAWYIEELDKGRLEMEETRKLQQDCDRWERESISDKSKLGLLRFWFGSKGMDIDNVLKEISEQVK